MNTADADLFPNVLTAREVAELAVTLRQQPRLVYVALIPGPDSWQLLIRPVLREHRAEFCAVADPHDGKVFVFTDWPALKDLPTHAMPLPTAAPTFLRKLASAYGPAARWDLSPGWLAAARFTAAMFSDVAAAGELPWPSRG